MRVKKIKRNKQGATVDKLIEENLKRIYSKEPSKKIAKIYDVEKLHKLWVLNNFEPFVKYFEDSYDFFLDTVFSINYLPKKGWGWKRNLQYIYFGSACRPLFKSFSLVLDGFYDEANSVARTAYELLVKIIFCSCYPDDIWSTFAKPPKGQREFNLSNFLS